MNLIDRCAPRLLVLTIAAGASVAAATVASAQGVPPAPPAAATAPSPPRPPYPPMGERGPGMHGGPAMELERLKTSLRLNASQAALWDRAQALMKPSGDPREAMRARRDRLGAMLDDPNFDPRKLAAEMDSADAERRAKRAGIRDAWFAVYDSLNPVQRGQAREFLRARLSRGHGHGGWMGWRHRDRDERGAAPTPPSPPR